MRVALVNLYYAPAEAPTARLLADVGAELVAAGHEVTAICSRRAYADPGRRFASRETVDGVAVHRVAGTGFGRGGRAGRLLDYVTFLAGAALALARLPRFDVVVVLTTPPLLVLAATEIARRRGARTLYWVMDVYPELAFELGVLRAASPAGRLLRRLGRRALRRSDRVVALGDRMARRLEAEGASRVSVVHNWADGDAIRPRPVAGHPLRRAWGWDGSFVALHAGNLGLASEFDTVLEAARLLERDTGIRLAFVGDGPRRAEIERAVARHRLERVELRPFVPRERLRDVLTAGDVHLIGLRRSLTGLLVPSKIYGVLAAGRPTVWIGPGDGEVPDILEAGRCGRSVTAGDARGLAEALRLYRDRPELAVEEGARARALFERCFTRRHGTRALCSLIEELAAR